jgi:hypothetical protein
MHATGSGAPSSDGTSRVRLGSGQARTYAVRTDGASARPGASPTRREEEAPADLAVLVPTAGIPTMRAAAGGFVLPERRRCGIGARNPDVARDSLLK